MSQNPLNPIIVNGKIWFETQKDKNLTNFLSSFNVKEVILKFHLLDCDSAIILYTKKLKYFS